MSNEKFKVKFGLAVGDTAATVDGTSGDINTDGSITALQNLDIRGTTTLGNAPADTVTVNGDTQINNALTIGSSNGDTLTVNSQVAGNITFTDNSTTTIRGTTGSVGANDYWKYGGGAVGSDQGYAVIATGDNGTEPIYAQQYSGGSVVNQVTLLDGSGNTTLTGDLAVNGGDITTTQTTGTLFNTTATTVNIGGAATTVSIGANTGTTTVNNSLVADDISVATVDTTNLEVTNIKAKDGTAAMIIADTTGVVTVSTELNVDNINISGNTIISTDTNGNIILDPNGTGNVVCTFSNGGNITNDRNYVHGSIRNATTRDTNGDIWELNTSAAQTVNNSYYRGLSLSNSADTTRGPATLMRSYTGNATAGAPGSGSAQRGRVIFEKARGFPEGVSSGPSAVQANDILGSMDATGYTSTGWLNDTVTAIPATCFFQAAESWISNTNLGTTYSVSLAPTNIPIITGANLIPVLSVNPQIAAHRSDATTFSQGKSGTTTYATLGLTGNTITALNASNVFIRQGTGTATVPGLILRYSRTDQTGSSDLDGVDFRLSTGGTTTSNSISRIESQYRTSGLHEFGITVSSDNFVADADTVYFAKADKTIIRTTPAGTTGTVSDTATFTQLATTVKSDQVNLQTAAGVALVGNKVSYNRVYGQWQYDATITPAAANTAYAIPFQGVNATIDFANIATTSNTSEIRPNALGMYKLQFSAQVQNADNAQDHQITFWWRKNGVDISNSAGYFTVPRAAVAAGALIVGWDNVVEVTTITDYYELMYAVSDTDVTLPYIAASAPRPGAASVFLTLVPIGA